MPAPVPPRLARQLRQLSAGELAAVQELVADLLARWAAEPEPATGQARAGKGVWYRQEKVRCGKPGCSKCAEGGHGPYWYAYFRQGGRMRSRYIGKERPT